MINVQSKHCIFRLQLRICQIHFLVLLIKPWEILRVLGSISSYKHDNVLYGNSIRTLSVRLSAILLLSRNSCRTCLFFSLLTRYEVYDIYICFWIFEHSNVRFCSSYVMNFTIAIHNHLFVFRLIFTFKHVGCGKTYLQSQIITWRCQTLKDLEKGMSNKNVTSKYGTSNKTFSIWVKSVEKLLDSLEKGSNIKRQKLKIGNFEMVDNFQLVPKYANKMFHYQLPWFKRRHLESPNN